MYENFELKQPKYTVSTRKVTIERANSSPTPSRLHSKLGYKTIVMKNANVLFKTEQ